MLDNCHGMRKIGGVGVATGAIWSNPGTFLKGLRGDNHVPDRANRCPAKGQPPQESFGVSFCSDRSGRVSNEPMFWAATKKTECANWQAGAWAVQEAPQERAKLVTDARPRYGRPEIESCRYA